MIGEAFERVVFALIEEHLVQYHVDYEILAPDEGKHIITPGTKND